MDMYAYTIAFLGTFGIGMSIRYASKRWDDPLMVSMQIIIFCFILSLADAVLSPAHGIISAGFDIINIVLYVVFYGCMALGALVADLIYRIRRCR